MRITFAIVLWTLAAPLGGLFVARQVDAATVSDFIDFSLDSEPRTTLLGRLHVPPEAALSNRRPLLVFLHGASGSGGDNETQILNTPDFMLEEAKRRGAFLYVPQASVTWSPASVIDSVMSMVNRAVAELNADSTRLYVSGYSMGGGGVWNILTRHSRRFAAAMSVSGVAPGQGFAASSLLGTAVAAWHARDDESVTVAHSRNVISSILSSVGDTPPAYPMAGSTMNLLIANPHLEFHRQLLESLPADVVTTHLISNPKLDLLYAEGAVGGHAGTLGVFTSPDVYDWLFAHSLVPEPGSLGLLTSAVVTGLVARRRPRYTTGRLVKAHHAHPERVS